MTRSLNVIFPVLKQSLTVTVPATIKQPNIG